MTIQDWGKKFESNQIFSENEAWTLFRLTAIAEAIGWTLLIIGIGLERYIIPGNNIPILLAGRIHGMLFILYAISAVGLYPSLKWSRKRAFIALIASVPPYGSLIFEQFVSILRKNTQTKNLVNNLVLRAKSDPLTID